MPSLGSRFAGQMSSGSTGLLEMLTKELDSESRLEGSVSVPPNVAQLDCVSVVSEQPGDYVNVSMKIGYMGE